MSDLIAYCGLDCAKCDAYQATQDDDIELKKKTAERWSKELDTAFSIDDITCDGCKSERVSGWCLRICKIRPCAENKGISTCASCSEYTCDELDRFLSTEPAARSTLAELRKLI